MTEIVDNFTKCVSAIFLVSRHLRHNEVALAEGSAFGIDTDKYVGYNINIKGVGQFDDAHLNVLDRLQLIYDM